MGRRVVETLGKIFKTRWRENTNLRAHLAEINSEGDSFLLALPTSFMNESGPVVGGLVSHFKIHFQSDLLVVVDDIALPLGRPRLRASGQDGGHQGLRSIEKALGTQNYARLRVGIAPPTPLEKALEEFVLQPFEAKEEKGLEKILERAAKSCRLWLTGPFERAMDYTNRPDTSS